MARMIPNLDNQKSMITNIGERLVYDSLKTLDDAIVFHSVNWNNLTRGRFEQGEGDFVVYVPGKGIIVLEVKSSDIYLENGKWYQTNRFTKSIHEIASPLHQADRTKFELIKILKENNIDVSVISAVWFPNIYKLEGNLPLDYNSELIFLKKDLNNPQNAILNAFNYCNFRVHDKDKLVKDKIIDLIAPRFSVIKTGQGVIDEHNFHFDRMTTEQVRILDFLTEQNEASIVGGAGTGKTVLAIEKANRLATTGPVLFLCFNRFLVDSLKERFNDNANIEVHNPQSLFYSFNKQSRVDIGNLDIDMLNDFLLEMDDSNWKYKHIVIDEGQDIDSTFIILLKDLCNKDHSGFFYVFYDQNQAVQNRDTLEWRQAIPCQLVLNTNCRNTINIAKTSHSVLNLDNIKIKSEIIGSQTKLYKVPNPDGLSSKLGQLIKKYLDQGYQLQDITIITLKTIRDSSLQGINRVGNYKLTIDKREGRSVLFTTARKFKGLESNIVIIIDMNESTFTHHVNVMLMYVASSRAKVKLDLFFIGNDTEYREMLKTAIDEEIKFPELKFKQKLNIFAD